MKEAPEKLVPRRRQGRPTVDVLIVNWNTWSYCRVLLGQLEALRRGRCPVRVLVVDNASGDGSAEHIAAAFPWVHLIRSDHNRGFAGGTNLGLRAAQGDYLWLLNADTELPDPRALDQMVEFLETHPGCGAVGPELVLPDGTHQSGAAGAALTPLSGLCYFLFLSRLLPRHVPAFCLDQAYWARRGAPALVGWVSGAAALLRREALQQVGGLPEEHFMYGEDLRLCQLLRQRGWDVAYLPGPRVLHYHGAAENAERIRTRWIDATLAEYGRSRSWAALWLMRTIFAGGFALRWGAWRLRAALRREPRARERARRLALFTAAALGLRQEPGAQGGSP